MILTLETPDNNLLQMSFDLISENIKYNKKMFLIFEHKIAENIEVVFDKAFKFIVDSNVFLRSILLSDYYFKTVLKTSFHSNL